MSHVHMCLFLARSLSDIVDFGAFPGGKSRVPVVPHALLPPPELSMLCMCLVRHPSNAFLTIDLIQHSERAHGGPGWGQQPWPGHILILGTGKVR